MKTAKKIKNRQAIRHLLSELADVLDAFHGYGVGGVSSVVKTLEARKPGASPAEVSPKGTEASNQPNEEPAFKKEAHEDHSSENQVGTKENDAEPPDDDSYDERYDYPYGDSWYYDPWDIQSTLDSAMSNLVASNLIPQFENAKNAPSFSEVCGVLFGADHEVTKQAEYFEELIAGYEDLVSKDDLREAYITLESLLEELGWKKKQE